MAKGDDLEERFVQLAADIILLCKSVPKDDGGSHLIGQLLRSGTSPAPNYAEARGAESDRDFLHKLRIVQKELNETEIWLKVMLKAGFASEGSLTCLREEVKSLARIITASIRTLKQRGVGRESHYKAKKSRLPIMSSRRLSGDDALPPAGSPGFAK